MVSFFSSTVSACSTGVSATVSSWAAGVSWTAGCSSFTSSLLPASSSALSLAIAVSTSWISALISLFTVVSILFVVSKIGYLSLLAAITSSQCCTESLKPSRRSRSSASFLAFSSSIST